MKKKIDIAVFLAKKDEFDRYKRGNPSLKPCTVGGHAVMYTLSTSPFLVIVSSYNAIQYEDTKNGDVEWRLRFWNHMRMIVDNTIGYDSNKQICVFAHFGNISYGDSEWRKCIKFLNDQKAANFDLKLISSSSKQDNLFGLGGKNPIQIPTGDSFLEWYCSKS